MTTTVSGLDTRYNTCYLRTMKFPQHDSKICPECGSPLRFMRAPLSRVCTRCDFQEQPGERKTGNNPGHTEEDIDLDGYRSGELGGSPYAN